MAKYAISFANQTSATSLKSILGAYMSTTATCFGEIVEVIVTGSGSAAAADIQSRASLVGCTFAGTGTSTSITPVPFVTGTTAAVGSYGVNNSAEPTTVSTVAPVVFGFNQRGGMRWAVPQGEGFKIRADGGTERGAVVQTIASAAGNLDATMHFWLQN